MTQPASDIYIYIGLYPHGSLVFDPFCGKPNHKSSPIWVYSWISDIPQSWLAYGG